MSKGAQTKLVKSQDLCHPNAYVQAMSGPYKQWIFDEQDCLLFKGHWRDKVFKAPLTAGLDLEIGPGSGSFLHHISSQKKERLYLALELKYKPLIKSAKKIKQSQTLNAKLIRYNARLLKDIFAKGELNQVYIYFPDPWPKKRHHKHRLIHPHFVEALYELQQTGSLVEIKTDHGLYFKEIRQIFKESPYQEQSMSEDLHSEKEKQLHNFTTFFESIFVRKNLPVYYARYLK